MRHGPSALDKGRHPQWCAPINDDSGNKLPNSSKLHVRDRELWANLKRSRNEINSTRMGRQKYLRSAMLVEDFAKQKYGFDTYL